VSIKIAIAGAGWYGCHIGATLLALGYDVTLLESKDQILDGASGRNQNRLHQGFHYPRHHLTRVQSRDGFLRFLERYPALSGPVTKNIYAVSNMESSIDYDTYRLIMMATGLHYTELSAKESGLDGIEGAMFTGERVIFIELARAHFNQLLANRIRLGTAVETIREAGNKIEVNGERFDYLVDCTWGSMSGKFAAGFFEPTLLLYYEALVKEAPAYTLVDGNLWSLYPTEKDGIFTLSHVQQTPLRQCETFSAAQESLDNCSSSVVQQKRIAMEVHVQKYWPTFLDTFRYCEPQFSIKTKIFGAKDDRACYVRIAGRRINVSSGKIDTIFTASDRVVDMLRSMPNHGL
jgi:hypothetical protein